MATKYTVGTSFSSLNKFLTTIDYGILPRRLANVDVSDDVYNSVSETAQKLIVLANRFDFIKGSVRDGFVTKSTFRTNIDFWKPTGKIIFSHINTLYNKSIQDVLNSVVNKHNVDATIIGPHLAYFSSSDNNSYNYTYKIPDLASAESDNVYVSIALQFFVNPEFVNTDTFATLIIDINNNLYSADLTFDSFDVSSLAADLYYFELHYVTSVQRSDLYTINLRLYSNVEGSFAAASVFAPSCVIAANGSMLNIPSNHLSGALIGYNIDVNNSDPNVSSKLFLITQQVDTSDLDEPLSKMITIYEHDTGSSVEYVINVAPRIEGDISYGILNCNITDSNNTTLFSNNLLPRAPLAVYNDTNKLCAAISPLRCDTTENYSISTYQADVLDINSDGALYFANFHDKDIVNYYPLYDDNNVLQYYINSSYYGAFCKNPSKYDGTTGVTVKTNANSITISGILKKFTNVFTENDTIKVGVDIERDLRVSIDSSNVTFYTDYGNGSQPTVAVSAPCSRRIPIEYNGIEVGALLAYDGIYLNYESDYNQYARINIFKYSHDIVTAGNVPIGYLCLSTSWDGDNPYEASIVPTPDGNARMAYILFTTDLNYSTKSNTVKYLPIYLTYACDVNDSCEPYLRAYATAKFSYRPQYSINEIGLEKVYVFCADCTNGDIGLTSGTIFYDYTEDTEVHGSKLWFSGSINAQINDDGTLDFSNNATEIIAAPDNRNIPVMSLMLNQDKHAVSEFIVTNNVYQSSVDDEEEFNVTIGLYTVNIESIVLTDSVLVRLYNYSGATYDININTEE